MKKLLFFILIIISASCGDEGFAPRPNDQLTQNTGGVRPLVRPCPDYQVWRHQAYNQSISLYTCNVYYRCVPQNPLPGSGAIGGTFTFKISNTGGMPMEWRVSPTGTWVALPSGGTATFTKPINAVACGSTPTNNNFIFYSRATDCPNTFQNDWQYTVELISVSPSHQLATTSIDGTIWNENKWTYLSVYPPGTCNL